VHRHLVADIIAMHYVQWYPELDGRTQGIRSYQVAAMNNCLRTFRLRFSYSLRERFCTIMTIRDYADFHFLLLRSTNFWLAFIVDPKDRIKPI
jgi:hypothetical protein